LAAKFSVRPTRTNDKSKSIYKLSSSEGRLQLETHHPTLVKRGAMSAKAAATNDEYDWRFGKQHHVDSLQLDTTC